MSLLSQCQNLSEIKPSAPILMLVGEPAVGKTLLGATFPRPLIVRLEDGKETLVNECSDLGLSEVCISPIIDREEQLMELLREVAKSDFKTVVFDSVTALNEKILCNEVLWSDQDLIAKGRTPTMKNVHGGFGAGEKMLKEKHVNFLKVCNILRDRGIGIVFICHYETRKVDEISHDPYVKGSMQLPAEKMCNVTALYKNSCDAIGFMHREMFVSGAETEGKFKKAGKVSGSGSVFIEFNNDIAFDCKSRGYNFPDKLFIEKGKNPILEHIRFYSQGQ